MMPAAPGVDGPCGRAGWTCDAEALARVRAVFEENFVRGWECGAALSIWREGREVLSLAGGFTGDEGGERWTPSTLVLVWSATKGPSSACVLDALGRAGLSLDDPVVRLWPAFGAAGKEAVTFRQVLAHAAGLASVADRGVPALDHEAVAGALAAQAPAWPPGTAHGYAPRAFGPILEEICRRASDMPLGTYWRNYFADPHQIDFWIGLPESLHPRVARMLPPRTTSTPGEKTPFERAFAEPGSLTHSAFSSPRGNFTATAMNSPAMRSASLPALGGIGSASALAKFYSLMVSRPGEILAGGMDAHLSTPASNGFDRVLHLETAFSTGFMLDPTHDGKKIRANLGPSLSAFGHPGAGGSLAFADPGHHIAFAYVMNRMEPGTLPRERTRRLVRALYGL
jgi:CubicO group peptidase (beta-lactamase class C family)